MIASVQQKSSRFWVLGSRPPLEPRTQNLHLEPSTYLISLSCEGFSNPLRRLGEGRLIEYELGLGGSPALLIATYGIDRVDESLIAVDKLDK